MRETEGKMSAITGGQVVVEILKAEGVRFVFGLPGGHTLPIYDAIYHTPEVRHILVRHEQSAANMAAGYAQLTGEPGICCVTAGPGATNVVSGIAEAFMGCIPVIVLAGRGPTRTTHRGASQEIPQEKVFAPITKWAVRVDRSDMIEDVMRRAFTIARSGRPGPVLVDFPRDLLVERVEFKDYVPVGRPPVPRGDKETVKKAVSNLLKASRPIVITGGGTVASGAFQEIRDFAEMLALPVLTSLSGRGSFPDDHPLATGGLGFHRTPVSRKVFAESDCVLSLGWRMDEMETNWIKDYVPAPTACLIQVDIDPAEIGRSVIPQIGIVGDVRLVLRDMIEAARAEGGPDHRAGFAALPRIKELGLLKAELEAEIEAEAGKNEVPLDSVKVVREINKVFPRETTAAIDVGCLAQALGGSFPYFKVFEPRSVVSCTGFYAMGFAASGLLASKFAYPERPAVGICGDGSFQMVMDQLIVAAEYRLPVTWCILDNQCLGSIRDSQDRVFGGRCIGTIFDFQPDFVKIAEACRCYGEKVEEPGQVKAALQRALDANKKGIPALLDFIVSRKEPQAAPDYFTARG
jgi:acetolactate synthase-1/2/3 large subunit